MNAEDMVRRVLLDSSVTSTCFPGPVDTVVDFGKSDQVCPSFEDERAQIIAVEGSRGGNHCGTTNADIIDKQDALACDGQVGWLDKFGGGVDRVIIRVTVIEPDKRQRSYQMECDQVGRDRAAVGDPDDEVNIGECQGFNSGGNFSERQIDFIVDPS